jgi:hypothetical protein
MGKKKHIAPFQQQRRQTPGLYPALTFEHCMKTHTFPEGHGNAPGSRQLAAAIPCMGEAQIPQYFAQ